MKFSSTVDSLSHENRNLKRLLALFGMGNVLLAIGVLILHDKQPTLVERTSRGLEIVTLAPLLRSKGDVEQAVRLMLKARLDTDGIGAEVWLSTRQAVLRNAEQSELKSRSITQAIVVRTIHVGDGAATAELDRVLGIGEVRSAMRTKVSLVFETVEPNELNPYGLKLATLAPVGDALPAQTTSSKNGGH